MDFVNNPTIYASLREYKEDVCVTAAAITVCYMYTDIVVFLFCRY